MAQFYVVFIILLRKDCIYCISGILFNRFVFNSEVDHVCFRNVLCLGLPVLLSFPVSEPRVSGIMERLLKFHDRLSTLSRKPIHNHLGNPNVDQIMRQNGRLLKSNFPFLNHVCAVSSRLLLIRASWVQLCSASCSHTPIFHGFLYVRETKFHTHTKQEVKLKIRVKNVKLPFA
jgi:hypothetical protein